MCYYGLYFLQKAIRDQIFEAIRQKDLQTLEKLLMNNPDYVKAKDDLVSWLYSRVALIARFSDAVNWTATTTYIMHGSLVWWLNDNFCCVCYDKCAYPDNFTTCTHIEKQGCYYLVVTTL